MLDRNHKSARFDRARAYQRGYASGRETTGSTFLLGFFSGLMVGVTITLLLVR